MNAGEQPNGTVPEERFSWAKFFSGLFNPLNYAKTIVFLFQGSVIVLLLLCVFFTAMALKNKFLPKKNIAPPVCINTQSGEVRSQSGDNRKIFGLINL